MSDTLDLLREQLRELELDAVLIRGRTEQLRDTISLLEHGPRRRPGRPRRPITVINMPKQPNLFGTGHASDHEPEPESGEAA